MVMESNPLCCNYYPLTTLHSTSLLWRPVLSGWLLVLPDTRLIERLVMCLGYQRWSVLKPHLSNIKKFNSCLALDIEILWKRWVLQFQFKWWRVTLWHLHRGELKYLSCLFIYYLFICLFFVKSVELLVNC